MQESMTGEVKNSIFKIIGLLGNFSGKNMREYEKQLATAGFIEDWHPVKPDNGKWVKNVSAENFIKDLFYPDFRNIMFFDSRKNTNQSDMLSKRYFSEISKPIEFQKKDFVGNVKSVHPAVVTRVEIFFFPGQIGLFSLTIMPPSGPFSLQQFNDLIFLARQFDVPLTEDVCFHEWISREALCGRSLRGDDIKADEYSGSKFKVFAAIDANDDADARDSLLFEMATVAPIGSVRKNDYNSPHPGYYQDIISKRISVFRNWEAICLFDSFTAVGNDFLKEPYQRQTWEYTYFRIYLFLLFFKFNLYRYNTELHDNTVKLRSQFEKFLNNYHITHISFNFLPNLIYANIREALYLNEEMAAFQNRINRISMAIQEERQSITNLLLQLVTILGAIGSVDPVLQALSWLREKMDFPLLPFYSSAVILLFAALAVSWALMFPEKRGRLAGKISKWFR